MTFLLDVNVLIALIDPSHIGHDDAHEWFASIGQTAWATCPITENGVIRIVGNPKYPNSPGSPLPVMEIVAKLRSLPGHVFWPDDVSLVGSSDIIPSKILTSGQVTDTYLLALAKVRGGKLATFDRKLSAAAVTKGNSALHLIATNRS
ncbi:PIN domain-containing protein family protein [Sinorhizobium meliloti CCNWSX0020]|uniref:Ribonuclease VapC n=2 Tax=Sinorhizobium TaxID=28105 RepID=H0FTU2_RHIML|nr:MULTISPECIES: TA system VapC family ribonuclease toxin [Sinorhizobium]EHK79630.1 PIN domain-containing protein family protein [Sinorhizobium meliloti CCNWSX0020]RVE92134.1 PIN domain-containing protein [Sinorhizobium meliloti]RVG75637.1 PIN domain-containing protein [Sinorhizobium meliloti]RVH35134.1 PIN domain-containing protein [Sinorhizobium meliloti]RVH37083.1 PIN domain-containing protein [Sinorhizobium meliloti]